MPDSPLTDRDVQARLQRAMDRYREAVADVQARLKVAETGNIPRWVFALDQLTLGEVKEMSVLLGQAEERRRAARAALHATIELMALQGSTTPSSPDMGAWIASTSAETTDDDAWLRSLDRFIGVMQYAKSNRVMFVNGDFRPVDHDDVDTTDEWDPPNLERLLMGQD